MRALALMMTLACIAGCRKNVDPASYVTGLRVFAIKAEPPEIAVGETAQLTELAVDTNGGAISIAWSECLDPPPVGDAINPDCFTAGTGLVSLSDGLDLTATMPDVPIAQLGAADSTGGVYLPLIAQVTSGSDALTASYRLRRNQGQPPNANPMLDEIYEVDDADAGQSGLMALDGPTPIVAHAGDEITLRATFMPGSAQTYSISTGTSTPPVEVTEQLSVSWFSTAGIFTQASTGADVPDTILHLDQVRREPTIHLPESGQPIDLWIVGRDERGGTDFAHRTIQFQ
jgi:hypothetical protein